MKRNANIIPLSKDHHLGLLFCWKIRQGIRMGVDEARIQAYVKYFWREHLQQHFEEEETILFKPVGDAQCIKAIEEHKQIEKLVETISNSLPDKKILSQLTDVVDGHIRFEERELFPHIELTIESKELESIGEKLQQLHAEKKLDDFGDEFWLEK